MSQAHFLLNINYPKTSEYYDVVQPIPLQVYWEHALSDQFSFLWLGLPIGFRYQILNEKKHLIGIEFLNHLSPPETPSLSPYLTTTYRNRLNNTWAIEMRQGIQSVLQFKRGGVDWAISIDAGPKWQFHPNISARIWIGALREIAPYASSTSMPAGISSRFSLLTQWDFDLSLTQTVLGTRPLNCEPLSASLQIKHYW